MRAVIRRKSFEFAVRVVAVSERLRSRQEFVLSRQILRSGTAIGALVREAEQAESRADFVHKMSVALKEASETIYWIELLQASGQMPSGRSQLHEDATELLRLLVSIVKTSKTRGRRT